MFGTPRLGGIPESGGSLPETGTAVNYNPRMTLRVKLAAAMAVVATVPMAVVVAIPWFEARARVEREARDRLDRALRQASLIVEREGRAAASSLDAAARALLESPSLLDGVLTGPEARARQVALDIAARSGLDRVDVLDAAGRVLSTTGLPAASVRQDGPIVTVRDADGASAPVWAGRRHVAAGGDRLSIVGDRRVRDGLLEEIADLSGASVAVEDRSGLRFAASRSDPAGRARVAAAIDLPGGSLSLAVAVPSGDLHRERRALLVAFGSTAPLALLLAIVAGAFLADRLAKPIRRLAARADAISNEHQGPLTLPHEPNEVRRLERSFDTMLDALERSEERRVTAERVAAWREVARRIAHEVKNPLSPIRLAVENLRRTRERAPEDLDRALDEETGTILEEVESLRRLVDEFSEFARLPRPSPAPCDFGAIVTQALAAHAGRIAALGVEADVRIDPAAARVTADAEQLSRALKNVLANALDAMEPVTQRKLAIAVRKGESPHGARAVLTVRDTGVGFEADARRRIFEPYFTTRADRGGTGLGMAIVYRIVADHAGTIEADGRPGRGATITITIPVNGPPPVTDRG